MNTEIAEALVALSQGRDVVDHLMLLVAKQERERCISVVKEWLKDAEGMAAHMAEKDPYAASEWRVRVAALRDIADKLR